VRQAVSIGGVQAVGEGRMGPLLLVLLGVAVPLGVLGIIGPAIDDGCRRARPYA
jgi:putative ABC transport system permease protein